MCESAAIARLIYHYAERIDAGDFGCAAGLLRDARIILTADGKEIPGVDLLDVFNESIIVYPDGTPRTKHLVTNLVVDFDGDDAATAHSSYLVIQQVDDRPIETVVTGRYRDRFARVQGEWRWTERDYSLIDLVGDQSRHVRP